VKYENFKRKEYNPFRLFKSLFRYATQRFKQTEKNQVKSGDLTLRKIDDCLFAIYKIIQANALWDSSIQKPVFGMTIRVGRDWGRLGGKAAKSSHSTKKKECPSERSEESTENCNR